MLSTPQRARHLRRDRVQTLEKQLSQLQLESLNGPRPTTSGHEAGSDGRTTSTDHRHATYHSTLSNSGGQTYPRRRKLLSAGGQHRSSQVLPLPGRVPVPRVSSRRGVPCSPCSPLSVKARASRRERAEPFLRSFLSAASPTRRRNHDESLHRGRERGPPEPPAEASARGSGRRKRARRGGGREGRRPPGAERLPQGPSFTSTTPARANWSVSSARSFRCRPRRCTRSRSAARQALAAQQQRHQAERTQNYNEFQFTDEAQMAQRVTYMEREPNW